jgi:hypothetical protein
MPRPRNRWPGDLDGWFPSSIFDMKISNRFLKVHPITLALSPAVLIPLQPRAPTVHANNRLGTDAHHCNLVGSSVAVSHLLSLALAASRLSQSWFYWMILLSAETPSFHSRLPVSLSHGGNSLFHPLSYHRPTPAQCSLLVFATDWLFTSAHRGTSARLRLLPLM